MSLCLYSQGAVKKVEQPRYATWLKGVDKILWDLAGPLFEI